MEALVCQAVKFDLSSSEVLDFMALGWVACGAGLAASSLLQRTHVRTAGKRKAHAPPAGLHLAYPRLSTPVVALETGW